MFGRQKYFFPVMLLLVFVLLFTAACGSQEPPPADVPGNNGTAPDNDTADPEPADPDPEEAVLVTNWENPQSLHDMIQLFAEISYSWHSGDMPETRFHYRYTGTEQLAGTETSVVTMTLQDDGSAAETFTVWVDGQGVVRQIDIGGQLFPEDLAAAMGEGLFFGFFWPFNMAQQFEAGDVLSGRGPGWRVDVTGSETRNFGGLSAQVHTVKVAVSSALTGGPDEGVVEWEVADFGRFQMLTGWRWEGNMEEEYDLTFRVEAISLR